VASVDFSLAVCARVAATFCTCMGTMCVPCLTRAVEAFNTCAQVCQPFVLLASKWGDFVVAYLETVISRPDPLVPLQRCPCLSQYFNYSLFKCIHII